MIKRTQLLCALLSVSIACYATAEVYRVINENGTVTYTDNPPAGDPSVESVDLPTINTQPAPTISTAAKKTTTGEEQTGYQKIAILTPSQGATIPPGHQEVTVQIALTPALQTGHFVQLLFNGQDYGPPSLSTTFHVGSLVRGEHSIKAHILDSKNNLIGQSNSITIYVKRHSIKHNAN
ncbi:MAG: DUF4124 domain-containing protein [Porticoccus sp.]|nr:DUF4124 domain-containing protein [Porticoccus sp.]